MNTTTPVITPEGEYVTVWTQPRAGYEGMYTVRTTREGGALLHRAGFVQFCHVRGAERAIQEHNHQVEIASISDTGEAA